MKHFICIIVFFYVHSLFAQTFEEMPISKTPQSYTLKTVTLPNKVELEYVEQGDVNGLPVLFLHGYTDSWHSFEMLLPYLPPQMHVYAITQRGHGNSSKPSTGYELSNFADDIAAFMQTLKLKPAVLVGHSMSSTIVQCFAVTYPELTKGIVLVSAFAHYNQPHILEFRDDVKQLTDPIDPNFVTEFQNSTIERPISNLPLETFIQETLKVPAYVWKGVAAGWDKGNFTERLKQYKKPALIVWGDKDKFCLRTDQNILKDTLKDSELLVYEHIGHAVHWETPERFAKDLEAFLMTMQQ